MDATRTSLFRNAQAFEHDLNARQRIVLDLIARGQTNAEIAAALGMTFDGAKWNVSEILSKLGLSSREEAADYWRWRQSPRTRVSAAMRALIPAGLPGKVAVAGGAATLVAVVAVVAFLFARDGDSRTLAATPPFRLEATVRVIESDGSTTPSRVTWEWQDAMHFRYDMMVADPDDGPHLYTVVADGTRYWSNDDTAPTYTNAVLPRIDSGVPPRLPISVFVGPAPARSMDALLDTLRLQNMSDEKDNPVFARVAGEQDVLGVRTTIVETGPVWVSQRDGTSGALTVQAGGVMRLWIDPETMFILRCEVETQEQEIVAEVERVEYHPQFDPGTFTFTPPPGKTEVRE